MNLRTLRRQLAAALDRRDWESVARLRQLIAIHETEQIDRANLSQIVESNAERIESDIATNDGADTTTILAMLGVTLATWFESRIYRHAEQSAENFTSDTFKRLNRRQVTARTSLPVNDDLEILPPPAEPPPPPPRSIDRKELLLMLSPLLVVGGARNIDTRRQLFDAVFRRSSIAARAEGARETAQWRSAISQMMADTTNRVRSVARTDSALKNLRAILGVPRTGIQPVGGFVGSIIGRLRHEKMRISTDTKEKIDETLGAQIGVGYTLHSRFLPTTAPDHAARDGWRFYRDNRAGSNLPWGQRLVPPYRVNCVCFTVPIYQDPEGIEHNPEFGIRINGQGEKITIRDVGTFENWFNQQRRGIKRQLMGDRLYTAAAQTGVGEPRFADFYRVDGKTLPLRRLLDESQAERILRRERVESVFRAKTAKHRAAWDRLGGQFGTDVADEAEYRRRLEEFLERLLK